MRIRVDRASTGSGADGSRHLEGGLPMLKRAALAVLSIAVVGRLLASVRRGRSAVVMMHRFANAESRISGHRASELHGVLGELRNAGVRLLSLEELVQQHYQKGGRQFDAPSVAFTVDDGYSDFAEIGLPVFRHFDCPVTCFVVPDVVDGARWFWWDQIDWLSRQAHRPPVTFDVPGFSGTLRPERVADLVEALKSLPTLDREELLETAMKAHGNTVPAKIPSDYAVLTWPEMRALESSTVQFGAHTLTHPILSRCDDDRSRLEITASVTRLRSELRFASSIFCYPNGMHRDFGYREEEILRATPGITGALSAIPGVLPAGSIRTSPEWRFRVPRFAFDARSGAITRLLLL